MKKVKSFTVFFFTFTLLLFCLSSCGGEKKEAASGEEKPVAGMEAKEEKEGTEVDQNAPRGRYVEEEITLPQDRPLENRDHIVQGRDGEIWLFSLPEGGNGLIKYSLQPDKSWIREEKSQWLSGINTKNAYLVDIAWGEDGHMYLLTNGERPGLYRISDADAPEAVMIPAFDTKLPAGYYSMPSQVRVLGNKDIAILDRYFENAFYQGAGGEKIQNFEANTDIPAITVKGNKFYAVENDFINFYDGEKAYKKEELPYSWEGGYNIAIAAGQENDIYLADSKGIHHLSEKGSKWETLVDGELTSLGISSASFNLLLCGDSDDFYMPIHTNGKMSLMHFYYDAEIFAVPPAELSIYSLRDCPTVKEVRGIFQREHPDVRVSIKVGLENDDLGITAEDCIKSLNTELLAGKGPDIILLDQMSLESFIEKGVLADLRGVLDMEALEQELLPGMLPAFEREGKLYALPSKIEVPLRFGEASAAEAADGMDSMAAYVKTAGSGDLLAPISSEELAIQFLRYYGTNLVDGKRGFRKEELTAFLEQLRVINGGKMAESRFEKTEEPIRMDPFTIYSEEASLGLFPFKTGDLNLLAAIQNEADWEYASIGNTFIPVQLMGINQNGSNTALAGEFMDTIFAEKVQSVDVHDGFPVNKKALEAWAAKADPEFNGMVGRANSTISVSITGTTKEVKQKMLEICKNLTTPVFSDPILEQMVTKEIVEFLETDMASEAAANTILEKTKNYFSE